MRVAPLITSRIIPQVQSYTVRPVDFGALQRMDGCDTISFMSNLDNKKYLPQYFQKKMQNYKPSPEEKAYSDALQAFAALDGTKYTKKEFEGLYYDGVVAAETELLLKISEDEKRNTLAANEKKRYFLAALVDTMDNVQRGEIRSHLDTEMLNGPDIRDEYVHGGEKCFAEVFDFYLNEYTFNDPIERDSLSNLHAIWKKHISKSE